MPRPLSTRLMFLIITLTALAACGVETAPSATTSSISTTQQATATDVPPTPTATLRPTETPTPQNTPTPEPTPPPPPALSKIDEPIEVGGVIYRFSQVKRTDFMKKVTEAELGENADSGFIFYIPTEAEPGEILYTALFEGENIGNDENVDFGTEFLSLSDNRGYSYDSSPVVLSGIDKGEKSRIMVAFKVDPEAEGLVINYHNDLYANDLRVALDEKATLTTITPLEGKRAEGMGLALTLIKSSRADQLDDSYAPAVEGKEYLVLEIAIDKVSSAGYEEYGLDIRDLDLSLENESGDWEFPVEMPPHIHSFLPRNLIPGERNRGTIAFLVPKDSTGYSLSISGVYGDPFEETLDVPVP